MARRRNQRKGSKGGMNRNANAWVSRSLGDTHAGTHHSQPLNQAHSMVAHLMRLMYP